MSDQPFRREAGSGATPKSPVDLVQWLTEQIDQDEQVAQAATDGPWTAESNSSILGPLGRLPRLAGYVVCSVGAYDVGRPADADAAHIVRHDPSRVLRQVAAYRRILSRFAEAREYAERTYSAIPALGFYRHLFADLASIYSDRPGFDPSWTVE